MDIYIRPIDKSMALEAAREDSDGCGIEDEYEEGVDYQLRKIKKGYLKGNKTSSKLDVQSKQKQRALWAFHKKAIERDKSIDRIPLRAALYFFANAQSGPGFATLYNINSVDKFIEFANTHFSEGQGTLKKSEEYGQNIIGRIEYFTKTSTEHSYFIGHGGFGRETGMCTVPEHTEIRFYCAHDCPLTQEMAHLIEGVTTKKIRDECDGKAVFGNTTGRPEASPHSWGLRAPRPYESFGSMSKVPNYYLFHPESGKTKLPINLNGRKMSDFVSVPDKGRGVPLNTLMQSCKGTPTSHKVIHWCACRSLIKRGELRNGYWWWDGYSSEHSWDRVEPVTL